MSSKTNDRIDSYHEVGKRGALICVVVGLILSGCLSLMSFILPFYVTTPYSGYHIYYYYNRVNYSPDINGDMSFSRCKNDQSNQDCNKFTEISSTIIGLNITAFFLIVIICSLMIKMIISKHKFISNTKIILHFVLVVICWCLLTASIHAYMKRFPNTKYCSYNGDNTGCQWYTSITILLSATCILCILFSVLIALVAPFCKIFKILPWLGDANDDIDNDTDIDNQLNIDESINDYHHKPLLPVSTTYNPHKRRKQCAYLTIAEWCSCIILSITFIIINVILVLSFFNEWYASDHLAQTYVNDKWDTAQCINFDGYSAGDPFKYSLYNEAECSFSYPDSSGHYNNTYWSCCNVTTCQKAFDYTSLMIGYNLSDVGAQCLVDMKAIVKASCHPNDKWFVYDNFNISQKPKQKTLVESKLVVCALFCKQTYDHCKDMKWNQDDEHKTVQQLWTRFDEFCEDGLGVDMRYEAFTDRCFAGGQRISVYYAVIFSVIVVIMVDFNLG